MSHFGTLEEPNLKAFDTMLGPVLDHYRCSFFGDKYKIVTEKPFFLTPNKGYTARSQASLIYDRKEVATVHTLALAPGDGTGSEVDYNIGDLEIPEDLRFDEKQWKVLPRKKKCLAEIFLPCFSCIDDHYDQFQVGLIGVSVDDVKKPTKVIKSYRLGRNHIEYSKASINTIMANELSLELTAGWNHIGERIGDPHTIISPKTAPGYVKEVFNVGAFIEVTDRENPVCEVINRVGKEPMKIDNQ